MRLAVASCQLAVGSWQLAVGGWWMVDGGPWAVNGGAVRLWMADGEAQPHHAARRLEAIDTLIAGASQIVDAQASAQRHAGTGGREPHAGCKIDERARGQHDGLGRIHTEVAVVGLPGIGGSNRDVG